MDTKGVLYTCKSNFMTIQQVQYYKAINAIATVKGNNSSSSNQSQAKSPGM